MTYIKMIFPRVTVQESLVDFVNRLKREAFKIHFNGLQKDFTLARRNTNGARAGKRKLSPDAIVVYREIKKMRREEARIVENSLNRRENKPLWKFMSRINFTNATRT